jgi:hypothetical protein
MNPLIRIAVIGASSREARETRGSLFPNRPAAMNPSISGNGALSGEPRGTHGSFFRARPAAARGPFGRWNTATNEHGENLWLSNGQGFQEAFDTIVLAAE